MKIKRQTRKEKKKRSEPWSAKTIETIRKLFP